MSTLRKRRVSQIPKSVDYAVQVKKFPLTPYATRLVDKLLLCGCDRKSLLKGLKRAYFTTDKMHFRRKLFLDEPLPEDLKRFLENI